MPGENIKIEEKTVKTRSRGKLVRQKPYVVAIVVLAVLAVAGIGFGATGMILGLQAQERVAEAGDAVVVVEEDETEVAADSFSAKDLLLRGDKVIDKDDTPVNVSISSSFGDGSISVSLQQSMTGTVADCDTMEKASDDSYKAVVSVNWDTVKDWYSLSGSKSGYENIEITNLDAERVVDVLVAGFGNGIGYETILFLMDDGTVEYIPVSKAVEEGFKSYGKIDDVEDVVRIRSAGMSEGCGGGLDVIAQKANGEFYDLYSILAVQGVWR